MSIINLLLLLCFIQGTLLESTTGILNKEVEKEINLKNKIIKITTDVTFKNMGRDSVYSYIFIISKNYTSSLTHISFKMKVDGSYTQDLHYKIDRAQGQDDIYEINFSEYPVNPKEERQIIIEEDHFGNLEFYPKKIYIKDSQQAYYTDILNYYSAYPTENQNVKLILPSEDTSIIGHKTSTGRGSNLSKGIIEYKLDERFAEFQAETFYIHYIYLVPFVVMNHAKREYRISHWGNIAVSENYQLANIGALLDGEFSRIDYSEYGMNGKNGLKDLTASLPMRASGLWYRDEVGNVSTSEASRRYNDVRLQLHPRFPIFGGWKSNFDIGYNLPTKFNVKKKDENGNQFMFNLTFGMPFDDLLAKNYSVKIVLPEGAENIKVNLPLEDEVEIISEKEYGCLDLIGRNSVTLKMKNVYDRHKVYFQVFYTFSKFSLAIKPIILVFYFLLIFSALVIYFRADWNLSPEKKEKQE